MKRFISAILTIMLMLSGLSAFAAPGDMTIYDGNLSEDMYVNNFAWFNGVMYMSDWGENIYTWTPETAEIKKWPMADANELVGINSEDGYASYAGMIPGDDGVYFMYEVYETDDEIQMFSHMLLFKPTINGEELVFDTEPYELDWDDLVEEYDDYSYANTLSSAFVTAGRLVGYTWAPSAEEVMAVVDIEDGDMELYPVVNVNSLTPYTEDKAIAVIRNYDNETDPVVIAAIDLETGETEELMQFTTNDWTYPCYLAYDAANDYLYYALNGELFRVKGMDMTTVESIAALNVDAWSNSIAYVTDDGFYVCGDYDNIIMRNTDPSLRATESITVYTSYNAAMEKALYDYSASMPDVEVIMANTYEDLTQAMLNRSSTVDIYTVFVNNQDFAAVFDRGYMAELDSSAVITEFVNSVYPGMQEVLVRDGHVVAIPVGMYTSCWSYNYKAFEKLGLTEDDVPKSWQEFLQFAKDLPALLGENEEGYTLFDPYYTANDARVSIFYEIIDDYMFYLQRDDVEFAFDTELMRGLVRALEEIDFAALGFPESYGEEMDYSYNTETILFQSYQDISSRVWAYNDEYFRPMPLAMKEGDEPTIAGDFTVAFVNPYSESPELAISYLESAVRCIEHPLRVDLCADFNEPLENAYYEENIQSYRDTIASWEEMLANAEDEEERAEIQLQIDDYTVYMEEYIANNRYEISDESIAFYRQYAPAIVPRQFIGFDDEASSEFYNQLYQYIEGAIDAETFLKNVDKKIRMMVLEDQ